MVRRFAAMVGVAATVAALFWGCAEETDDRGGTYENAGHPCQTPSDCYPDIDAGTLQGEVVCMDRVPNGYCTHLCQDDSDCCAVPGECESGHPQVCSPFESAGDMYCFLSCEDVDVGSLDPAEYCHRYADVAFGCRSSGGGTLNRKVCVP